MLITTVEVILSRDKSEKFIELANKRVNRAIKDIQLIANLSNRQNYHYSEEQAKVIINALQSEVDDLKRLFKRANQASRKEFNLDNIG